MTRQLRFSPGRLSPVLGAALALCLALPVSLAPGPARAQANLFAPVLTVNGMGISGYEIDQRVRLMRILRQPGDLRAAAEKSLIEDRLRMWKAKQDGHAITPEAVNQGMTEFAGRANLTREQFLAEIAKEGVSEATFRDFVTAGSLWREVVRARYLNRIRISDADVDRALQVEAERGRGTRILISEIIIPTPPEAPPEYLAEATRVSQQVSKLRSEAAFAEAARQYSATASRERGGRLDWLPLENLPPQLRQTLMALKPGEASEPIEIGGALAIFMLRGMDEGGPVNAGPQRIGYATLSLGPPGDAAGAELAARVAADAKRCDDLYTVARNLPAGRLERVEPVAQGAIATDLAVTLAGLDIGETAVISRPGSQVLVMLCARERAGKDGAAAEPPNRETVRNRLLNERIGLLSDGYLADLVADAVIVRQ